MRTVGTRRAVAHRGHSPRATSEARHTRQNKRESPRLGRGRLQCTGWKQMPGLRNRQRHRRRRRETFIEKPITHLVELGGRGKRQREQIQRGNTQSGQRVAPDSPMVALSNARGARHRPWGHRRRRQREEVSGSPSRRTHLSSPPAPLPEEAESLFGPADLLDLLLDLPLLDERFRSLSPDLA